MKKLAKPLEMAIREIAKEEVAKYIQRLTAERASFMLKTAKLAKYDY